ncbi:hypothetical protein GCM10027589_18760 [Actinocorallia lasiicapitis]
MRRPLLLAVLLTALIAPAAQADPADVLPTVLDVPATVLDVDLDGSVVPLERREGATLTLSSDVLFAFGEAALTDQAKTHLAKIADGLRGKRVRVAGFTDTIGSPAANLALSRRRAEAVRDELIRLGVADVTAKGYGEARPVAPNVTNKKDDPDGRARNRRVEITS